VTEHTIARSLHGQHQRVENLWTHPRIEEHFAGREADALSVDAVLAELYSLGELGIDVHADDEGRVAYSCTLVMRTGEGSVVVIGESVLSAALGCLLEALTAVHEEAERGLGEIEDYLA
jgi:hypothetical protein